MSETNELMVRFKTGVTEDIARAAVKRAGATVRRRMRTDFPAEVLLLVRVPAGTMTETEAKLKGYPVVVSTEVNEDGFGTRED